MARDSTRAATAAAIIVAAGVWLTAQAQEFQFFISAVDASGAPVAELKPEDVVMSEDGVSQPIIKVERLGVPIKLTIAIDNGIESRDALPHYRAGLTGLVEALPPDVEITLITIAPQPRTLVKPTTDRAQVLKGIQGFGPDGGAPRFSDTLVEFSQRLQKEAKDKKIADYVPVLLMVSTTSNDAASYQPKQMDEAVRYLVTRRAKFNLVIVPQKAGDVRTVSGQDSSLQAVMGMPTAKATGGRAELLPAPARLATLLPEWGKDLAALHLRQARQFRVTVERGGSGPLKNPKVELSRSDLKTTFTQDGWLPQ